MVALPRVRYGVLGSADIARQLCAAWRRRGWRRSRPLPAAAQANSAAFAVELGIPRHHASDEALLADPAIDAVHIPLPNDLHAPWAIRSVEVGSTCCAKDRLLPRRPTRA
jgi:predicted dehydrogenase